MRPLDRRDRQERAVGRLTLGAKRGQHDVHDVVVALDGAQQHFVEAASLVVLGGAREFVLETEGIEEAAQHGVVVIAEARVVAAERIGHRRQRHLEIRLERLPVRNVFRDFAHAVHVVGEAEKARLALAPVSVSKAWRTIVVRATSPNVPMCGRPEGP